MDDPGKKCDICGERQLSANGWIRYRDPVSNDFIVKKKGGRISSTYNAATYKDACGHSCVIKAFVAWLTAVHVNAPVEGKRDETP